MKKNDLLSENLEDYLEAILELEKLNKVARAKDIAEKLGVTRASVTGALKALVDKGMINYEPYSFVTLTEAGNTVAQRITRNHQILKKFLIDFLRIDEETSNETACRMEHAVDEDSIDRLVDFLEAIQRCPRCGDEWLQKIKNRCSLDNINKEQCLICISENRRKVHSILS